MIWAAVTNDGKRIDVVPVDDQLDHDTHADCVCGPRVEKVGQGRSLVVHYSLIGANA